MALVKCPACKADISSEAQSCPKCGHPMPRKTSRGTMGCAIFFACCLGFLLLAVLVTCMPGSDTNGAKSARRPTPAATARQDEALLRGRLCKQAQDAVLQQLKAPATADFPACVFNANEYEIRRSVDGKQASVIGHVDAQNSFGAKLRRRFVVMFKADAKSSTGYVVTEVAVE
jgi:hypothetical protein